MIEQLNVTARLYFRFLKTHLNRSSFANVFFYDFRPAWDSNVLYGSMMGMTHVGTCCYVTVVIMYEDLQSPYVNDLIRLRILEGIKQLNSFVEDPFVTWVKQAREDAERSEVE